MSESKTTTDHDTIRSWAEARGAHPVTVSGTGSGEDAGVIRLDFPGYDEDRLEPISWDEWFQKFDDSGLAFLYQDEKSDGEQSNFNKLVRREGHEEGKKGAAKKPAHKTAAKASGEQDEKKTAKAEGKDDKKPAPKKTAAKAADKTPVAKSETKAAGTKAGKPASRPAAKKKSASAES